MKLKFSFRSRPHKWDRNRPNLIKSPKNILKRIEGKDKHQQVLSPDELINSFYNIELNEIFCRGNDKEIGRF